METAIPVRTPTDAVMAEPIQSVRHPLIRRIADVLRNRSAKPKTIVIDDLENIQQAVDCGVEIESVLYEASTERPRLTGAGAAAPRYCLDGVVTRTLFGEQKRSRVFALARAPKPESLGNLVGTTGDLVILDGVRIVGNIGAITRTACALNAGGVVLVESGLSTPTDRRLVRASRGLVFAIPVVLASRADCVRFIQREQLTLAALSAHASEPVSSIRAVPGRLGLLMGSERDGVSAELDALTTHRYGIPMSRNVESLNVSVAAGIALFAHGSASARRLSVVADSF